MPKLSWHSQQASFREHLENEALTQDWLIAPSSVSWTLTMKNPTLDLAGLNAQQAEFAVWKYCSHSWPPVSCHLYIVIKGPSRVIRTLKGPKSRFETWKNLKRWNFNKVLSSPESSHQAESIPMVFGLFPGLLKTEIHKQIFDLREVGSWRPTLY